MEQKKPIIIKTGELVITAIIPIKRDKSAPNKNIRGNMTRRNLELSSDSKDEKADGDTTAVKNIIEPIRAEQRNISIR